MLKGIDKVEGLTPEQIETINQLAQPLVEKKDELLGKIAKQGNATDAHASELERLRQFEQATKQQNAESEQNYQKALELAKGEYSRDLEKFKSDLDGANNLVRTLLIDNGLSDALDKVNINPSLKHGAIALLKDQLEIQDGKAVAGDKELSAFIEEWSQSDMGKAYTLAPNNSGAGASQTSHHGSTKTFSEMSESEKVSLYRDDPDKFRQMAAK